MQSSKALLSISIGLLSFLLGGSVGSAGTLVDPGGLVEDLIADPARNVFYATLDTQEIITLNASTGSITDRELVSDDLGGLAAATDGSKLYVALDAAGTVSEYDLPGVNFNRSYAPSGSQGTRPGLAAKPGRLYISRQSGLAVMDTSNGAELYYGNPASSGSWMNMQVLKLSPDGDTLYAMNTGLSPASIFVLDVSEDAPQYIGEDCCHGCIGGNGRGMELSPDGALAYVVVGGQYHLQVMSTVPLLHDKFAGLTGPYPNAVAVAADGDHVYVGYSDAEFAVVRTSDWLPFHVGDLQGDVVARGLALSYGQTTLAAVIEFTNFDPDRIELINVGSPQANRGGIRVSPVDDVELIPVVNARVADPVFDGDSSYIDVANGVLARAPIEPATFDTDITASGYTAVTRSVNVTAGNWADLGQIAMSRTGGDMPDIAEVCASPAAVIGQTVEVDVTGRGFYPGTGLEVTTTDPKITIDSFVYQGWSRLTATVSVEGDATPGLSYYTLQVTNPDGDSESGHMLRMFPGPEVFDDGFESGNFSYWTGHLP